LYLKLDMDECYGPGGWVNIVSIPKRNQSFNGCKIIIYYYLAIHSYKYRITGS
jgi:hypothetical protein